LQQLKNPTGLFCLIGNPINQSLSPSIQNSALAFHGIDARYMAFNVPPESLKEAIIGLKALGVLGINVTIPHKTNVIPLLDGLSEEAANISAVNTIKIADGTPSRFIGYNTDGPALIKALESDADFNPRGAKVFCVGAGGSARACLFALAKAGIESLTIYNRTKINAIALLQHLQSHFPRLKTNLICPKPGFWDPGLVCLFEKEAPDLILNTTPLRQWTGNLPFFSHQVVCDLVYSPYPSITPMLSLALEGGAKPVTGLSVLVHQGALAFSLWTGHNPPVEAMWQALRGEKGGNDNDT